MTTENFGNGSQTINAGSNLTINVGNGSDVITIGSNDILKVGNGSDTITAGSNDQITDGNGHDTIVAGDNSTIIDGNGNDNITVGANSSVTDGNGSDTITAGANSSIAAGSGDKVLTAGSGSTITAGDGNHTITAGANSTIAAGNGSNTVVAGAHNQITLGNGTASIDLGAGDTAHVGLGNHDFAFEASNTPTLVAPLVLSVDEDGTIALPISTGFGPGFGQDTIFGFSPASDTLTFFTSQFADFDAVIAHAAQVGADTVITADAADTITLKNTQLSSLTASDFTFVSDTPDPISVTITGIPADASLSDSAGPLTVVGGTITVTQAQLAGLALTAGEVTTATLTVTATDTVSGNSVSQTITLTVNPVAPTLSIASNTLSVDEDGSVLLGIGETPFDPRDTVLITISGVPADATLSAGTNNGGGMWTLTPAQLAGLTLTAGEEASTTLTVTAINTLGATASISETISLAVVDVPPVFTSGAESVSISDIFGVTGSALPDTAAGSLAFNDPDLDETHSVTVALASATSTSNAAIPSATLAAVNGALATTLTDSTGIGSGAIGWTFSIPDSTTDFLSDGETLTATYNVTLADPSGASATQTVTVTITGSNDPPLITSGPQSASLQEQPGVSNSPNPDTASGSLAFTDPNLDDAHQVSVALDSAVWSAGLDIPDVTQAALAGALTTALTDSTGTGSGSIGWNFSIPDEDVDFLATGETLTATYDVTVQDPDGATSTQTVKLTIAGSTDPIVVNPATETVFDSPFADNGLIVSVGDAVSDFGDSPGDQGGGLTVTSINGSAGNVDTPVTGTFGTLVMDSSGFYTYTANSIDQLQVGDTGTDQFTFTVDNGLGQSKSTTLTFNIVGGDDNPIITSADTVGSVTANHGGDILVNGGFESGDLTGWTAGPDISADPLFIGGQFGNFSALLGPTSPATTETLSQSVQTDPGQVYTLDFYLAGDLEADSNSFEADFNGAKVAMTSDDFSGGFTEFTANVTGTGNLDTVSFKYATDGVGMFLDDVTLSPQTAATQETTNGTIHFSDAEPADTHVASFNPEDTGYLGTFSLAPVNEAGGTGSVGWSFVVNNSDLSSLSPGQVALQTYDVTIADNHGGTAVQPVTIALHGA